MSRYRFIREKKADYPLAALCRALHVSRSGYYAWAGRKVSARAQADAELTARIAAAHARSRRTYGAPRIHAELRAAGVRCARKRVARLMQTAGLVGCHRRRRTRTTVAEPTHVPAPNLVARNFSAPAIDRLWLGDITYVAVSHAHKDHTANLNQFASSTWLTSKLERDFMFKPGNERVEPKFYDKLERGKWIALDKDEASKPEYDVFGDGAVMIKPAPGHTPGHQVLVLNLKKNGRVMVAGDLYHYSPERTFKRRPPDNEFSVEQSAASRAMIEDYLAKTHAAIWIQHDFRANAKLKKSPAFYE